MLIKAMTSLAIAMTCIRQFMFCRDGYENIISSQYFIFCQTTMMADKPQLLFFIFSLSKGKHRIIKKHFKGLLSRGCVHRAEFLPVEWRSPLPLDGGVVATITPERLKGLRHVLNSSVMDIMYYTSPLYRSEVTTVKMHIAHKFHNCQHQLQYHQLIAKQHVHVWKRKNKILPLVHFSHLTFFMGYILRVNTILLDCLYQQLHHPLCRLEVNDLENGIPS